mmetsp:Transcript_18411/g.39822  ORF Transcript_18411/g.39822 Transcript_18411/m.39822 type:complete len:142 (+) Transcript_18411:155-580(+)
MGLNNRLFCCGSIPSPSIYSRVEDLMDLIDGDRSQFPPGLRRESRDEQHDAPDRHLTKTAGNALHKEPPPAQSTQRISVIVPGQLSSGETIYVNFLDENKKPKTISANIPPNSYPGMHFFVDIPTTNQRMPPRNNEPAPLV